MGEKRYELIKSSVLVYTLIATVAIVVGIDYIFNIKSQHSLYENITVIAICLWFCIAVLSFIGLYNGYKLRDDIGKITNRIDLQKYQFLDGINGGSIPSVDFAESPILFIVGIIAAIAIIAVVSLFVIITSWFLLLLISAILYWGIYRVARLVLKNSKICKSDVSKSLKYSMFYTTVYVSILCVTLLLIQIIF